MVVLWRAGKDKDSVEHLAKYTLRRMAARNHRKSKNGKRWRKAQYTQT